MKKLYIFLFLKFFLINLIITFISTYCYSQIICPIGQNIQFNIDNITTEPINNSLNITINNSNPTVFYIDSVKFNNISLNLSRTYYDIEIQHVFETPTNTPIALTIYGTGLAGNDTITELQFHNIIDNSKIKDTTINIILQKYIPGSYAKLAKITNIYPNPTNINNQLYIEYSLDIPSNIIVKIYSINGKEEKKIEIKNNNLFGKNTLVIDLNHDIYEGKYFAVLESSSGTHFYPFIVLN